MSRGDLTAVIPVHQLSDSTLHLKQTILSASKSGIEIIIVINNESAFERKIIRDFLSEIDFLNFQQFETDAQSPGQARNIGLKQCRTEFITFWDADDFPQVSSVMELKLQLAKNPFMNFGVGSFVVVNPENSVLSENIFSNSSNPLAMIKRNPGIWRWIFRTTRIEASVFQEFKMGEDQDFISDLDPQEYEMLFTKLITYRYVKGWKTQLTANRQSIDQLSLSIEYLFERQKSSEGNSWSRAFLRRQLLTALKKGSARIKIFAIQKMIRLILKNA